LGLFHLNVPAAGRWDRKFSYEAFRCGVIFHKMVVVAFVISFSVLVAEIVGFGKKKE